MRNDSNKYSETKQPLKKRSGISVLNLTRFYPAPGFPTKDCSDDIQGFYVGMCGNDSSTDYERTINSGPMELTKTSVKDGMTKFTEHMISQLYEVRNDGKIDMTGAGNIFDMDKNIYEI